MSNAPADGQPHLPTLIGRNTAWSPEYSADFDHFGVDTKRNRLLLAAEDHGTVEVFNLDTGAHERTSRTFGTPHAILYLPKQNKFVITDSSTKGTNVIDAATFKHIHLAHGADSMAFDETTDRLYIVSGGKDAGMTHCIIDEVVPATGTFRRRLRVDADLVEAMVHEMQAGRLFVNTASQKLMAVVDKKSLEVIAHCRAMALRGNLTMVLDEAHHRLFVGTLSPNKLFVMNTDNDKTVAMLDGPASSDSLFYDGARSGSMWRVAMAIWAFIGKTTPTITPISAESQQRRAPNPGCFRRRSIAFTWRYRRAITGGAAASCGLRLIRDRIPPPRSSAKT